MNKEELKAIFIENVYPIFEDKLAQDDVEILDFYYDVMCEIAVNNSEDLKEDILSIIDSENSGLSIEQRINEIKKLVV
jgi:hypothetical protein